MFAHSWPRHFLSLKTTLYPRLRLHLWLHSRLRPLIGRLIARHTDRLTALVAAVHLARLIGRDLRIAWFVAAITPIWLTDGHLISGLGARLHLRLRAPVTAVDRRSFIAAHRLITPVPLSHFSTLASLLLPIFPTCLDFARTGIGHLVPVWSVTQVLSGAGTWVNRRRLRLSAW